LDGKPAEGGQGNHAIVADANKPPQAMANAGAACFAALRTNTVAQDQVTTVHANGDAVTEEGDDSAVCLILQPGILDLFDPQVLGY
jgi:hypothetical protein